MRVKGIVLREKEAKISKTRRFLKKPFLWLIRNMIFYKNWIFRPVEISTGREKSTFAQKNRKIRFWAKLWLFFERNKIPSRICTFSNFRNFLTRRIFYGTEKFQPEYSCHITNTFWEFCEILVRGNFYETWNFEKSKIWPQNQSPSFWLSRHQKASLGSKKHISNNIW